MSIRHSKENRIVLDIFNYEMQKMFKTTELMTDRILTSNNGPLILGLPKWVGNSLRLKCSPTVYKSFSLGNLFGTALILLQDKLIDEQETGNTSAGEIILSSNIMYYKWIKEYQRVFISSHLFWVLFEKYLEEFTRATIWEKNKHWNKINEFKNDDLIHIGQKYSLLKISAAGICLYGKKNDWINVYSELINYYHIGFQLYDDLIDWKDDLNKKNYTYFLTKIHAMEVPLSNFSAVESFIQKDSFVEKYIEESNSYYSLALNLAHKVCNDDLYSFIQDKIKTNKILLNKIIGHSKTPRLASSDMIVSDISTCKFNPIHTFCNSNDYFLLDINRNLPLKIDREMKELIDALHNIYGYNEAGFYKNDLTIAQQVLLDELVQIGVVTLVNNQKESDASQTSSDKREVLTNLGIIISEYIDDKLNYSSSESALEAVNLLFIKSGYWNDLFAHLYVEYPLEDIVLKLISNVLTRLKKLSAQLYKNVSVSLNIKMSQRVFTHEDSHLKNKLNGLKNNIENNLKVVIESITPQLDNVTINLRPSDKSTAIFIDELIHSLNGNDENRIKINLSGAMCKNGLCLSMLPKQTENQSEINYIKRMIRRINPSKKYKYFCNAGKSYITLATDGNYYPCHSFAETRLNPLGKKIEDIHKSQIEYLSDSVDKILLCKDCWIKNICGGGCIYNRKLFDGSPNDYQTIFCNPFKRFVENSIVKMFEMNSEQNKSSEQRPFITVPCDNF